MAFPTIETCVPKVTTTRIQGPYVEGFFNSCIPQVQNIKGKCEGHPFIEKGIDMTVSTL